MEPHTLTCRFCGKRFALVSENNAHLLTHAEEVEIGGKMGCSCHFFPSQPDLDEEVGNVKGTSEIVENKG